MRAVINRTLYDTEAAERIATHCPNPDRGDFGFLKERLYRTDSGAYFIAGEGGPKTKYATQTGDGTAGSSEIRPVSADAALDWCEKHSIDAETILDEFGDQIEEA